MKNFIAIFLTLSIPLFLFITTWQASKYSKIERALSDYDKEQYRLIEENKRKISAVAILLRNERIEKIAENSLNMKRAASDEIMRIEIDKENAN